MAMDDYKKSKFVFSETFNNTDGKTSGSGFTGVILGLVVSISWLAGIFGMYYGIESGTLDMFFTRTLALGGTAALLLGARKFVDSAKAKKDAS